MERFSTSLIGEAKTLLLATDCSPISDGAVQEAIFFGQACAAQLIVLHVVQADMESLKSANAQLNRQRQEIAPYMEHIRNMARDSGVQCEIVVVPSSSPEETIVEQARLRNADVILMGRHGRAGRLHLMSGSLIAKVISQGFPSVLVVPKDFLITGAHVLVAVGDGPSSGLAAEEALSLRRCATLQRLTFLAVAKNEAGLPAACAKVEEICAAGRAQLSHAVLEAVTAVGHPSDVIVQMAEERGVDMIMLGGLDKTYLPKMFMGRVAKEVCGWATCSVLVVTANATDHLPL